MAKKSNNLPIDEINELAEVLKSQELTEIEVESEKFGKIKVRREFGAAVVAPAPVAAPAASSAPAASAAVADPSLFEVSSPMVGSFYAAASPGADPFVKVGDKVKKGQTLCIVEAMKLMNELPSEVDGEVVEILANDSDAISFGQVIMKIKTA